ncbi:MAG: hypothetical protein FH756_18000 [Firmicutes bacterium]|nr:hypothetical protein [Bacillota bacterium]
MDKLCSRKIITRASLVVCLRDAFAGGTSLQGSVNILLKDYLRRPLRKAGGYYVFTGLHKNLNEIVISSEKYLDERVTVDLRDLDPQNPVVNITLLPSPAYPFPAGATLIYGTVLDVTGNGVKGAYLSAVVSGRDNSGPMLARDGVSKGDSQIHLTGLQGGVSVGDCFLVKEAKTKHREYCRVAGTMDNNACLYVEHPLQFKHSRGVLFLPCVNTRTDHQGQFVVGLRSAWCKDLRVTLDINYGDKSAQAKLNLQEGERYNTGTTKLS